MGIIVVGMAGSCVALWHHAGEHVEQEKAAIQTATQVVQTAQQRAAAKVDDLKAKLAKAKTGSEAAALKADLKQARRELDKAEAAVVDNLVANFDSHSWDADMANEACKERVMRSLRAPSTATWVSGSRHVTLGKYKWGKLKGKPDPTKVLVQGEVDAQNSFGAMLRTGYECDVYRTGSGDSSRYLVTRLWTGNFVH